MTTTVAGFLQNLVRSGARPLARPKLPGRNTASVRERSEERAASVPAEVPPAVTVDLDSPATELPPPPRAEPVIVAAPDTEPRPPEPPSPEPRTAEVVSVPSPTAPQPIAASDAPARAAKAPDHASVQQIVRTVPAERGPAAEQDAVDEKLAEPRAAEHAAEPRTAEHAAEPPPRATNRLPERRMPAPAHVKEAPPKGLPASAARMVALREIRTPERPLPAPRVEFAIAGERVSVLPKPAAVQDSAPPTRDSDQVVTAAAVEPRVSPVPAREPPASAATNRDPPAPMPGVPQGLKSPTPAPVPVAPMPPVRREAENTISIRQLDIQIIAEEPRRPQGRNRREPAPAAREPVPLGRYYVREMP
jgi:hypothetical protein